MSHHVSAKPLSICFVQVEQILDIWLFIFYAPNILRMLLRIWGSRPVERPSLLTTSIPHNIDNTQTGAGVKTVALHHFHLTNYFASSWDSRACLSSAICLLFVSLHSPELRETENSLSSALTRHCLPPSLSQHLRSAIMISLKQWRNGRISNNPQFSKTIPLKLKLSTGFCCYWTKVEGQMWCDERDQVFNSNKIFSENVIFSGGLGLHI